MARDTFVSHKAFNEQVHSGFNKSFQERQITDEVRHLASVVEHYTSEVTRLRIELLDKANALEGRMTSEQESGVDYVMARLGYDKLN